MINRAILVGRLTRDPDLRYTASGAAVATFTVAVNRQFTNQQGEREADFIIFPTLLIVGHWVGLTDEFKLVLMKTNKEQEYMLQKL